MKETLEKPLVVDEDQAHASVAEPGLIRLLKGRIRDFRTPKLLQLLLDGVHAPDS